MGDRKERTPTPLYLHTRSSALFVTHVYSYALHVQYCTLLYPELLNTFVALVNSLIGTEIMVQIMFKIVTVSSLENSLLYKSSYARLVWDAVIYYLSHIISGTYKYIMI